MSSFVHLHLHTEYSLLDGAIRLKKLFPRLKELGMDACAITDHGVMYGMVEFYENAIANGIKPIIGCEVYTAINGMENKFSKKDADHGHLVLLAENNTGLKNLMKIVSKGFTDGFYYKPRVDYELIKKHHDGIIALSACLSGDIPKLILNNRIKEAKKLAEELKNVFGEKKFYLELQMHGISSQTLVNRELIKMSKELDIPLVATNDAHYLNKDEADAHEVLLCVQTGKKMSDDDRMKFGSNQFYVKSYKEMHNLFPDIDEAFSNTVDIANRCNVKLDFETRHLPEFKIDDNVTKENYIRNLAYKGALERYSSEQMKAVSERLDYELSVIKNMGFIDYFLIVWDFIKYAKDHKIMVGPGRGSGAGSVVAYCLGITNIDSLKYNLIFERFLNPERVSMPDIDVDFCYRRRQEVIDYVVDKYGKDKVCQIITFGTMAARAGIRDVGRALDIPYAKVDKVAKMIPMQIGITIEKALELNPSLKEIYSEDSTISDLIDKAILFEGMPRHASTHAAGVVIAKEPITNYIPLQTNDDILTTQLDMTTIERMGLLKMDFLGLRTLTVIQDCVELINDKIDIDKIPFDDANVYNMISQGKTSGVFQLESSGMTSFMKDLNPTSLEDIIAGISLYRPGPMDQIPTYIKNKKNPDKIVYDHKLLESILDVTYGCIVYQEQVMQIFRSLGGYSMGRADLVRRAMSKKKHKVMQEEASRFISGAKEKGVSSKIATKIYDTMKDFASYAFNKSHAAAYAVIAYQTAYLKYYYPIEFMTATLNSFSGNIDKLTGYIQHIQNMGIAIKKPDINKSFYPFSVENGAIRFGMNGIKHVGEKAIVKLEEERALNGEYTTYENFLERIAFVDINKRCIESLIKAGCLDLFKENRRTMLLNLERLLNSMISERKRKIQGQISMFDLDDSISVETNINTLDEFDNKEILNMEKEVLGLYLSGHPLDQYREILNKIDYDSIGKIKDEEEITKGNIKDRQKVKVAGLISNMTTKTTKNNQLMAFITIEDFEGELELVVFPQVLKRYADFMKLENACMFYGELTIREDEEPKVLLNKVEALVSMRKKILTLSLDNITKTNDKKSLFAFLCLFKGNTQIRLMYHNKELKKYENKFCCEYSNFLLEDLIERLGEGNVTYN